MTFVFVPTQQWALIHSHFSRTVPYFSSIHFVNLLVLNPVLSTEKSTSTERRGRALRRIMSYRIGVTSALCRHFQAVLNDSVSRMWPRSCASRKSDMNRRADTVL